MVLTNVQAKDLVCQGIRAFKIRPFVIDDQIVSKVQVNPLAIFSDVFRVAAIRITAVPVAMPALILIIFRVGFSTYG